ncbi:FHA domain-containing protein [Pseudenhygromyxa sp. WMMC2535]|nr:FHA domain-containing protein [Pseudenhygromyxa sp. WMMC2535]
MLEDALVSREHARLYRSPGKRWLRDLGSRNGTLINGEPVQHHRLQIGDRISIPANFLRVESVPTDHLERATRNEETSTVSQQSVSPSRASLPAEHLPAEHLPAEHLPAEHLPAEHLPAERLSQQSISQQSISQQSISQQSISQQSISQQSISQQSIPQQSIPQQSIPQQSIPQQRRLLPREPFSVACDGVPHRQRRAQKGQQGTLRASLANAAPPRRAPRHQRKAIALRRDGRSQRLSEA